MAIVHNPQKHPGPDEADISDIASLAQRAHRLLRRRQRVIIGLTGPPGVGKSTLSSSLIDHCGVPAVVVPFDGFHLSSAELTRLGRQDRKGAIDTFDIAGYRVLLSRLAAGEPEVIYAPDFDRERDDPISAAVAVPPDTRLILTEGNYLLVPEAGINRALFDEVWYLDLDDHLRIERLINRHVRYGKQPEAARQWALERDEVNTRLIQRSRLQADLVVHL
jgi:pantothenate kinase